jgi:hypothetical protein
MIGDKMIYCEQCDTAIDDDYGYIDGVLACSECLYNEIPEGRNSSYYRLDISDKLDYGPYLGLELELNIYEMDIVDILKAVPSEFYTQTDSSLVCGIEITSEPITLNYFKHNINNFYAIFDQELGTESSDCGLHIHMSKEFGGSYSNNFVWTKKYLSKLLVFIDTIYDDELFILSRRSSHAYSSWAHKPNYKNNTEFGDKIDKNPYTCTSGYSTVRTYSETDTIEIRAFATTTDKYILLANMEFVQSLASFVLSSNDMTWDGYKRFLHNHTNKKNIEYLMPYLSSKDLI